MHTTGRSLYKSLAINIQIHQVNRKNSDRSENSDISDTLDFSDISDLSGLSEIMSKFKNSVINVVSLIPHGKVVSYGQVALYVGIPRGARQVGWILNGHEKMVSEAESIPWWRVVNNKGRISIKGSSHSANEQKELLKKEGLLINEDFSFDIEEYRWRPKEGDVKKFGLETIYLESILPKLSVSKQR